MKRRVYQSLLNGRQERARGFICVVYKRRESVTSGRSRSNDRPGRWVYTLPAIIPTVTQNHVTHYQVIVAWKNFFRLSQSKDFPLLPDLGTMVAFFRLDEQIRWSRDLTWVIRSRDELSHVTGFWLTIFYFFKSNFLLRHTSNCHTLCYCGLRHS
jgi:hypothetical protein